LIGSASGYAFGIGPEDRLYIMMPMYHSAGGILGASQVLIRGFFLEEIICYLIINFLGCSAVIRTKFSATNFWQG
jgi:acyl-CoA synthetase (AMP-forming)/AMP-acid ligase II